MANDSITGFKNVVLNHNFRNFSSNFSQAVSGLLLIIIVVAESDQF